MVINNLKKYIPNYLEKFIRKYIIPSPLMSNLSLAERGVKLKNFYALKMGKTLDLENPVCESRFFDTKEKLYIAELTFYPGGGVTSYHPEAFNKALGDKLNIDVLKEGIKL